MIPELGIETLQDRVSEKQTSLGRHCMWLNLLKHDHMYMYNSALL